MATLNSTELYGGRNEMTMETYESLTTVDTNTDYNITDFPTSGITNDQMTAALTYTRLFPDGTIMICSDDGTYTKGHMYQVSTSDSVRSWTDITPSTGSETNPYIVVTANSSTATNATNTASAAVAIGNGSTASGSYSIAIGNSSTASSNSTVSLGNSVTASGSGGIAMGNNSTASGASTIAIGSAATSDYNRSIAIGASANTYGATYGIAMGYQAVDGNSTYSSKSYPIAIGYAAKALSTYGVALGATAKAGGTSSSNTNEIAIGYGASATGVKSIQIGRGTNSTDRTIQFGGGDSSNSQYFTAMYVVAGTYEKHQVAYLDNTIIPGTSAPDSTVKCYRNGTLYVDYSNKHLYVATDYLAASNTATWVQLI